jgi:hypothetical protein
MTDEYPQAFGYSALNHAVRSPDFGFIKPVVSGYIQQKKPLYLRKAAS